MARRAPFAATPFGRGLTAQRPGVQVESDISRPAARRVAVIARFRDAASFPQRTDAFRRHRDAAKHGVVPMP